MITGETVNNQVLLVVGLGEMQVSTDPNCVLSCLGLGSCIGISAFDPVTHVGAMVHVVLPHHVNKESGRNPARYADTAVPAMLKELEKKGAIKNRIIIKIAGGARIINTGNTQCILDIGERNCEAVKAALSENGLEARAEDLHGTLGRSMWLYISNGITKIRTIASPIREL